MSAAKEILPPGAQLLWALCHDCKKKHPIRLRRGVQDGQLSDWWVKHQGHAVEFLREAPPKGQGVIATVRGWFRQLSQKVASRRLDAAIPWLSYADNVNDLVAYAASGNLTWTLASLASSSTLLAGRESNVVDNTANLYYDYLFGGYSTVGTSPSIPTYIEVWLHGSLDDTPHYVDPLVGSDAAATFASGSLKSNALTLLTKMQLDITTSNVKYPQYPTGIAQLFGASGPPKRWGAWMTQSTGANLHATAGNHVWSQTGLYGTS